MIKKLWRSAVTEKHGSYVSWYRDRFGTLGAISELVRLTLTGRDTATVRTPAGTPVTVRAGTADMTLFDQIFVRESYRLTFATPPAVIIDAGAHIGLAAIYFAERYPTSMIVSLEPEPSNYELLVRNVSHLTNIKPIPAALWGHDSIVGVSNPDADTWSYRFEEGGGAISAFSVQTLMKKLDLRTIDFLKMDIEGSEIEVLQTSRGWIRSVKSMLIELHDRSRPGCADALRRAIASEDFAESLVGDCVMCSRPGVLVSVQ